MRKMHTLKYLFKLELALIADFYIEWRKNNFMTDKITHVFQRWSEKNRISSDCFWAI